MNVCGWTVYLDLLSCSTSSLPSPVVFHIVTTVPKGSRNVVFQTLQPTDFLYLGECIPVWLVCSIPRALAFAKKHLTPH